MRAMLPMSGRMTDLHTREEFHKNLLRLADGGADEIVIDLRGLVDDVLPSLAVGAVVSTHQKLTQQGRRLVLTGVSDKVRELLDRVGLVNILTIEE